MLELSKELIFTRGDKPMSCKPSALPAALLSLLSPPPLCDCPRMPVIGAQNLRAMLPLSPSIPVPCLALPSLFVSPVTVLMSSCSGPHVPSTPCVRMEIFCFLVHTLLGTFHSRSSQFAHSFTGAHKVGVVDRAVIRRCTRTGKDHKDKEEKDSENVC